MNEGTKDREIEAVTLFGNLEHSSAIGELRDLDNYSKLLEEFQQLTFNIITKHLEEYKYSKRVEKARRGTDIAVGKDYDWNIYGDSFHIYLYSGNITYDMSNILLIAMKIQLAWFTSQTNMKNMKEDRPLLDLNMGIDSGMVILGVRTWRHEMGDLTPRIEGQPVNRSRTIAMLANNGKLSKIFLSEHATKVIRMKPNLPIRLVQEDTSTLEGIIQDIPLYELAAYWDHEVFDFLPEGMKEEILGNLEQAFQRITPAKTHLWLYPLVFRYYLRDEEDQMLKIMRLDSIIKYGVSLLRSFTEEEIKRYCDYYITINNMIGMAYFLRNRYEDDIRMAANTFRETLRYTPKNIQAVFKLAECMIAYKNYNAASKLYRYILNVDPDNAKARELLKEMEKI